MRRIVVSLSVILSGILLLISCGSGNKTSDPGSFSASELEIIEKSDNVMYVLDVADKADSVVLRMQCTDLSDEALKSPQFQVLKHKLLSTVQSEQQGGVGLASPQIGISRNVIAVCRTDKEGEPYEVYPNIKIVSLVGDKVEGPEGCLSVPPYRGMVKRYQEIEISYKDIETLETKNETIKGYAAVIFQHECDHLNGVLYTDRADTVYYNSSWDEERKEFKDKGLYDKPQWMK